MLTTDQPSLARSGRILPRDISFPLPERPSYQVKQGGTTMIPLHDIRDEAKVKRLADAMDAGGWQGPPLVIWDVYNELITGVHRYAAAQQLGWEDSEIPTVDIADVYVEAGLDFSTVSKEWGDPEIRDAEFAAMLDITLPTAIKDRYGIDIC